MKKVFFLAILIATTALMSCSKDVSKKQVDKKITVTADTTILVPGETRVLTAPRWSCSGKKLSQPKLLGVETGKPTPLRVQVSKDTTITGLATITTSDNSSDPFGLWPVLWGILQLFAFLILLVITAWIIKWIFSNWPQRSTTSSTPAVAPATKGYTAESVPTKSDLAELAALVTAVASVGGGTVKHKDVLIAIGSPSNTPVVYVENSGDGASIIVQVGEENHSGVPTDTSTEKPSEKKDEQ